MSKPYDPDFHSSVVRNLRELWTKAKKNRSLSILSDAEVWICFEAAYGACAEDDRLPDWSPQDIAYVMCLEEALDARI